MSYMRVKGWLQLTLFLRITLHAVCLLAGAELTFLEWMNKQSPVCFLQAGFILLITEKLCLIMFLKIVGEDDLTIFLSLNSDCLGILPSMSLYDSLAHLWSYYMFKDCHIITPFPFLSLKPLLQKKKKEERNTSNSTRKSLIRCWNKSLMSELLLTSFGCWHSPSSAESPTRSWQGSDHPGKWIDKPNLMPCPEGLLQTGNTRQGRLQSSEWDNLLGLCVGGVGGSLCVS